MKITPRNWLSIAVLIGAASSLSHAQEPRPGEPGGRDYEFRHENVLGISLELCVRADTEEAARSAEARAIGEIDRLAAAGRARRRGRLVGRDS